MTDEMLAGRYMDERIAVEVLGWKRLSDRFQVLQPNGELWDLPLDELPPFSDDLLAAWRVVEYLRFRSLPPYSNGRGNVWIDLICRPVDYEAVARWNSSSPFVVAECSTRITAKTPPLAICRVALRVVWAQES